MPNLKVFLPTQYWDEKSDCGDGRIFDNVEYSKCGQNVPKIGIAPFNESLIDDY